MSDAKGKDVSQRHQEGTFEHDPQKEAQPANKAAAKVVVMRRELKAVSIAEGFSEIVKDAENRANTMGLTTGHFKLDARLHGLRRKHVTALGGRTSFGKTSKALQICDLNMNAKPLFISVEDGVALSLKRLMARRAKVNAIRLRNNQCTKEDIAAMKAALARAERVPFFVDAVGVPVEDICVFIRQHCKQHGSALVVVDYLQKLRSKKRSQDRRIEVGDNAMMLADAIKESNAAGLLLSQLSRPDKNKPDAEPTMYDLKEAGEIENACEHVLIGHARTEDIPGAKSKLKVRTIRICKNKDGPVFDETIDQDFDEVTASFKETGGQVIDDEPDEQDSRFRRRPEADGLPADDPRFADS